jgi:hypothetical protein
MFENSNKAAGRQRQLIKLLFIAIIAVVLLAGRAAPTYAQNNFNSGSTGADGAFAPTSNQTLQVPASGVFNFTTINVPAGVIVTFTRNAQNTPVTILASGDVTIGGSFVVSGQPGSANGVAGLGGPGGFAGGIGGFGNDTYAGVPGNGPGGGGAGRKGTNYAGGGGGGGFAAIGGNGSMSIAGLGGAKYGTLTLLPLIGGSGGGGGGAATTVRGAGGGGGGGAILLASSGNITFSGTAAINAPGGIGGPAPGGNSESGAGGGGSGGAIRIIANIISGPAILNMNGGTGGIGCYNGGCGGAGGAGYLRVEAYDYSGFTPNVNPSAISYAQPNPVVLTNAPDLRIASVGGIAAPASPLGSFQGVPDVIIPATQANPVSVALEAVNIPVGTVVQVLLIPAAGTSATVASSPLAGTNAASTGTANVTLPAGMSVLSATATIDLTIASARPVFIDGERVNRIEVAAVYGGSSQLTYITQSGRRIKR